jgi:hypothetical protein
LVTIFLLFTGNALARHSQLSLLNTVWTGDITVVDVNGKTTVLTASSLTFLTESADSKSLSGTLSAPAISFSAIRSRDELSLGAVDYVISADIDYRYMDSHHDGHSRRGRLATLKIQGSNVADGSIFFGTLTKQ